METKSVTLRLPVDLAAELDRDSKAEGISRSALMVRRLRGRPEAAESPPRPEPAEPPAPDPEAALLPLINRYVGQLGDRKKAERRARAELGLPPA